MNGTHLFHLHLFIVVLGAAGIACSASGECPAAEAPEVQGPLEHAELAEVSGVAASAVNDDVFYAHNDRGDSSRLFAFTRSGRHLASFEVKKSKNEDWEDLALGPCAEGSCLYIADTGDNDLERIEAVIYRVVEPDLAAAGETALASERFPFRYPDGPHDVEAMLVHPSSGVVTLVTKEKSGPAGVYEVNLPATVGETVTAVKRGELDPPQGDNEITGGAIHPEATGLLLRTKTHLFYYAMEPGQSAAEAIMGAGCSIPVADERRGEAVTWLRSGAGFLTVGEGIGVNVYVSAWSP